MKFSVVDLTQRARISLLALPTEVFVSHGSRILTMPSLTYESALWKTYPPNTNYGLLSNMTKAPILDLQWSLFSPILYTVSADQTLCMTDVNTGQRTRKIHAHRGIINALDRTLAGGAGVELIATASDDGTVKIWEGGEDAGKQSVATFEIGCPVTSVCWSADGANVYIGALDNEIHVRALLHFFPLLKLTASCRYTIFENQNKSTRSLDILKRRLPWPSPPTDHTFFHLPSPLKL